MNARLATLLLVPMLWMSTALAQITETKLVAGEGILFGQAVAVAGDRAVVGVGLLEGNAAYSYRRVGDGLGRLGTRGRHGGVGHRLIVPGLRWVRCERRS